MTTEPSVADGGWTPIGRIRARFTTQSGTPVQGALAQNETGVLEVFHRFAPGLLDLEGFSHLFVLTLLDRTAPARLRLVPYLDDREHGVFATRSPCRPNPIGLTVVRLVGIRGNLLDLAGVDMLDGTPVLDIKPYVPEFDHHAAERVGWFAETAALRSQRHRADDRFAIDPVRELPTAAPTANAPARRESPRQPTSDPIGPASHGPGPGVAAGILAAVCLGPAGQAKRPQVAGRLEARVGLAGDGHAGSIRPVSLLMGESVVRFNREHGFTAGPGELAENLLTRGIDLTVARVGDRFEIGPARLEVVQIGKETSPDHYSYQGHRLLPTEGVFCQVTVGGEIAPGDLIVWRGGGAA